MFRDSWNKPSFALQLLKVVVGGWFEKWGEGGKEGRLEGALATQLS